MKNYLLLSVATLLSFSSPVWSADVDAVDPLTNPPSPKASEQATVIQELLSKKFDYFGEKLRREIQKIEKGEPFKQLKSIKKSLTELQPRSSLKRKKSEEEQKEDRVRVNVFVEKEDEGKEDDDKLKRSLLAAAYFPEELEQDKSPPLINFVSSKFIHKQLAWALSYGHPLAEKYLVDMAVIYDIPSESICEQSITEEDITKTYNKYPVQFVLKDVEGEAEVDEADIGDEDINKKVTFSPSSKEALTYFKDILDKSKK